MITKLEALLFEAARPRRTQSAKSPKQAFKAIINKKASASSWKRNFGFDDVKEFKTQLHRLI